MATTFLAAGRIQDQFFIPQAPGTTPGNGVQLFCYAAGSTTKVTCYKDNAGATPWTNPIVLDSTGNLPSGGEVWVTQGQSMKFVYAPSNDTDPPASPYITLDNYPATNDVSAQTGVEWLTGPTPTFVSATSFTLVGDQTATFTMGRRVKTTNTGGTIYSTITASAFGALTTITVVNDSGTLDSGLSAVSYGLLAATNTSLPWYHAQTPTVDAVQYFSPDMGFSLLNGYLDWTVAASALTVAIKGWDGNDPSATNPVYALIRDVTATTGLPVLVKITAANSVVVSSGSTLGTRNAIPCRVWAVLFNDAGTLRLGVINCLTTVAGVGAGSDVTAIYPLSGWGIASSTAEGGAGAADSAQTFYTGTAVTSKPYAVLGYATFESGQSTAGTWATAASRKQLWGPSVLLPGQVIQIQRTATGAVSTGTTTIPADDTIPQSTEGDQYMSQAITPSSAANVLDVEAQAYLASSIAGYTVLACFQDATANALFVGSHNPFGNNASHSVRVRHRLLSALTVATTFKVRIGSGTAGTTTFNGQAGARLDGGVLNSFLEIVELMA